VVVINYAKLVRSRPHRPVNAKKPVPPIPYRSDHNPNAHSLPLLFLVIALVAFATPAWAKSDMRSTPVEVNGDQVEYFEAEKKIVGQGNVVVTYKDIRMTCDKVETFLNSKEATAEGNVVITRGEDVLKGNKIVYNFQEETGLILDGVTKAGVWYGGGKELKKISRTEVDIDKGYLTTCDLDKPHYKLQARQIKIYLGEKIVAKNVTVSIGKMPVLFFPTYSQSMNDDFPNVSLVPGHDKKWGTYLLSKYRYSFDADTKGSLHLDYRQYKGFGEGLDYTFKNKYFGKGYFRAYYMDERDRVQHTEEERWRVQYRHKWDIRPDTIGILEYHRFKDKDFVKDYFYREEFERNPQPESYVSLIHTRPNYSVSLLGQKRVNRFFTEVERLPEIEVNVKNQQLAEGLPFFYKADFAAVSLNRKIENSDQDNNAIRVDTYNQLSLPLRLINFLSVDPYVGTRQTFYTRQTQTDEERFRGALYSGVDVSTNFYKTYDCKTNFLNLNINDLRHIFIPNISYSYVQKPTLLHDRLFEFDDIDTLDKSKAIGLTFVNKLQTKRLEGDDLKTTELARFVIGTDYLFHLAEGDRFSDVSLDLELRPYSWLFMKQDALYDPKWKDLKSLNTDLAVTDPKDKWRFGVGHRYEEKFSSQVTAEAEAVITPKWKCRAFGIYEFKGSELKEQEYSITRDLHCWEAEFTYSARDVHTFWLIFRLKAFPELPFKLGTSYYRPSTGSNN